MRPTAASATSSCASRLKVIQRELGEQDPTTSELDELRQAIAARQMPEAVEARALKELDRLKAMPAMAPEAGVVRTYLDWLVALPWQDTARDCLDLKRVAAVLDERHYGLQAVKDRVLEFIAVRKLAPTGKAPILCFVGPPGVGKTSLGRVDRRGAGPPVRAHLAGRRARRGGDPRPPAHVRRRAAGPHHPGDEDGGRAQSGARAGRNRQARRRLSGRSVGRAARSARSGAERDLLAITISRCPTTSRRCSSS